MFTKKIFQPRAVQHRAGAEHAVLREPAQLRGGIGENIHGIGDDQQNTIGVVLGDFGNNALENADVLLDQIETRLTRFLSRAGGHDDDRRVGDVLVLARVNAHRLGEGQTVADVEGFSLRLLMADVDQHHLGEQSALHQGECRSRPHESAADNGCFSYVQ